MKEQGEWRVWVYIMASKSRAIYTGVSGHLHQRVWEHKNDLIEGFTQKYKCHRLVHFESFDDIRNAIEREKEIKGWRRSKKVALIEASNPTWEDLAEDWYKTHRYAPESRSLTD